MIDLAQLSSLGVFPVFRHSCCALRMSCAIVALAITIQGIVHTINLPRGLQGALGSSITAIECANGDKLAAIVFSHSVSAKYDKPQFSLATRDFLDSACVFRHLPVESRAQHVAGHPSLSRFFVGTENGWIYVLDIAHSGAAWRCVGRHPEKQVSHLRCSPDGNLIVVNGLKITAAWNAQSGELLWQRPLNVTSMSFAMKIPRLFCSLECGEIVELDPARGDTIATLTAQSSTLGAITVSSNGELIAAVSSKGRLVLFDVASRSIKWSSPTASGANPMFTEDCSYLLTTEHERQRPLVMLRDVESGGRKAVSRLSGTVGRLAHGPGGTFLTWSLEGPVYQWRISQVGQAVEIVPAGLALAK